MKKQITLNVEARNQLLEGVKALSAAVKVTLGPRGRNVILDKGHGVPSVTKDGVSVAKQVVLDNPVQNLGCELVKSVASKTNDIVGDGTTTATVLAEALTVKGLSYVSAGVDPLSIKRGIDKGVQAIVDELDRVAMKIMTKTQKAQIASISANSCEIGELIADVMQKVGDFAPISVEESPSFGIEMEVVEGMQFDKGYISPYMAGGPDGGETVLEDACILLTDKNISSIQDILKVLEDLSRSGVSNLVIIADDVEGEALATLILNKMNGKFNAVAVKAPGFGDGKAELLEDLAVLTGASVVTDKVGLSLREVGVEVLGKARRVLVTKDKTTIVDGGGDAKCVSSRIEQLKSRSKSVDSDYEKQELLKRVAKLSSGVAVLKVGAASEVEVGEIKDRIEDALNATRAAIEEGVVAGGGIALLQARSVVDGLDFGCDERFGLQALMSSVEAPIRQIAENAGQDGKVVVAEVLRRGLGYNAYTGEYEDLIKTGVIDPKKVTRSALQNAASIATMIITTEVVVANINNNEN